MEIYTNQDAKSVVSQFTIDKNEQFLVFQWKNEDEVLLYTTYESFALLHKVEHDPYYKQKQPYVLDLIYTTPEFRKQNHATIIVNKLKEDLEFTAFSSNYASECLFRKLGLTEYFNRTFRWPSEVTICCCGKIANFRCSRCLTKWYCCRECQVKDYELHKLECICFF
jgi:hypothetical protein